MVTSRVIEIGWIYIIYIMFYDDFLIIPDLGIFVRFHPMRLLIDHIRNHSIWSSRFPFRGDKTMQLPGMHGNFGAYFPHQNPHAFLRAWWHRPIIPIDVVGFVEGDVLLSTDRPLPRK